MQTIRSGDISVGAKILNICMVHSHGGFVRISVAKLRSVYRAGGLEGSGD